MRKMGFLDSLKAGLQRSREAINEIFYMGGEVEEDSSEASADTLVMGASAPRWRMRVTDDLREQAARENLTSAPSSCATPGAPRAQASPTSGCVLRLPSAAFVGINGAGKTTTRLGARARQARDRRGRHLPRRRHRAARGLGPARRRRRDHARARRRPRERVLRRGGGGRAPRRRARARRPGACTPPPTCARRAGVGSPASAATMPVSGGPRDRRHHRAERPQPAKAFNDALDADGTHRGRATAPSSGGIALAISSQLGLPIYRIGVGETLDDLQAFDALEFCRALVGEGM